MKKRILALLLAALMVVGVAPAAFAAEGEGAAKIGDKSYGSLKDAFEAAKEGETVTLLSDVNWNDENPDATAENPIVVEVGGLTIDLGGNTLTADNFTLIFEGENFTITNGNLSANGGSYALFVGDEGTTDNVSLENLTLNGGINVYNADNVVIRNCTVVGTNYYAVWADKNAHITIESGNFSYLDNRRAVLGLSTNNASEMTVTGGDFAGDNIVLESAGSPTIVGGTFETAQDLTSYIPEDMTAISTDGGTTFEIVKGTVDDSVTDGVVVAKVGDEQSGYKYYGTLQKAIDEAPDGATVELIADTKEAVLIQKPLTLVGNGKTIDATGASGSDHTYGHGLQVYDTNGVTIKNVKVINAPKTGLHINASDVTLEGTIEIAGCKWGEILNVGFGEDIPTNTGSTLHAEKATFVGVSMVYSDPNDLNRVAAKGGSISINLPEGWYRYEADGAVGYYQIVPAATVEGKNYGAFADAVAAAESAENKTITLMRDVEAGYIALPTDATLDLNGKALTISAEEGSGIGGEAAVKNGTIKCDQLILADGVTLTDVAVDGGILATSGKVTLGEGVSAGKSDSTYAAVFSAEGAEVSITGGTYTGEVTASGGTISITGGKFSTDVSNYVADGYVQDSATLEVVVKPAEPEPEPTTPSQPSTPVGPSTPTTGGTTTGGGTTTTEPSAEPSEEPSEEPVEIEDEQTALADKPFLFEDVSEGDFYYDAVKFVFNRDLMEGTSATAFEPQTTTDRAMIATIVWRLAGEPEVEFEAVFDDVADGQWYSAAVIWAAKNEIVKGYGDGTFKPEQAITREELVTILHRYAGFVGLDTAAETDLSEFVDGEDVQAWAEPAMRWAVQNGIITGTTAGEVQPQVESARWTVAVVVNRFCAMTEVEPTEGETTNE